MRRVEEDEKNDELDDEDEVRDILEVSLKLSKYSELNNKKRFYRLLLIIERYCKTEIGHSLIILCFIMPF